MSLLVVVSCIWPTTFQKSCECSSMNVGCTLFLAKPTIKYQKHVKKVNFCSVGLLQKRKNVS